MNRVFEADVHAPPPWVRNLGMTGLLSFSFFAFLGIAGAHIGILLMLTAVVFDWHRFSGALRRSPIPWLFIWFMAAAAISTGLGISRYPNDVAMQLNAGVDALQVFFFVLVGWWLQGGQRLARWVFSLALMGFALGVYRALDAESLNQLLALQRPHFRWSINAIGEYAAASLLGMAIFTPRYWRWLGRARWRWPAMLAWSVLMGLAGAGVVLSLSRGVWLALTMVVCILVLYLGWMARHDPAARRRLILTVVTGMVLLAGAFAFSETIRGRVQQTVQAIVEFVSPGQSVDTILDPSGRIRGRLLVLGVQNWLQSPWFGHGPSAPELIIREHAAAFDGGERFKDFHNLAVDLLVSFGVLGSLPLVITFLFVLGAAHRGFQSGRRDRDVYLAAGGLLLLSALAQMTDTRILSSHGRFFSMLFAGTACSGWLAAALGHHSQEKPSSRR